MDRRSIDSSTADEIRRLATVGQLKPREIAPRVGVSYQTVLNYMTRWGLRDKESARSVALPVAERARPGLNVRAEILGWGVVFFRTDTRKRYDHVQGFHLPDTPLVRAIKTMEQQGCVVVNREEVLARGWTAPREDNSR